MDALALKAIGWLAAATGWRETTVKWALFGALGLAVAFGAWRAWSWVDGLRETITAQKAEISARDQEIGGLRISLSGAVDTANQNAAALAAEQLYTQALLDRMAQLKRDNQRRESRLQEALDAIDKWTPEMDGAVGPGLRGVLGQLRGQGTPAAAPDGDAGAANLRHGP
jgi:hypothetical protein